MTDKRNDLVNEIAGAFFGVVGLMIGGFAFGSGLKFTLYWWGCIPNFFDGISWMLASSVCIYFSLKYCHSYLKNAPAISFTTVLKLFSPLRLVY